MAADLKRCGDRSPSNRQTVQPSHRPTGLRAGFTLLELLAVMTLIAMLIGVILGAAQYVIKTARQRRAEATAAALRAAITTYRHEYGKWPLPDDSVAPGLSAALTAAVNGAPATNGYALWTIGKDDTGIYITFSNKFNFLVFDVLRASTNNVPFPTGPNPKNIKFTDDSTVMAEVSRDPTHNGQRTPRHLLPSGANNMIEDKHTIIYMNRAGATDYYGVKIEIEKEVATVTFNP